MPCSWKIKMVGAGTSSDWSLFHLKIFTAIAWLNTKITMTEVVDMAEG